MVQLHDHGVWSRPGPNYYWKLDTGNRLSGRDLRSKLSERNFSVLKSTNNARLRALYVRSQRGMPSYEGISLRELKLHATRHALTLKPKATPTSIKAQLEKADDGLTFDYFLDLPPELRRIVFQHYYDSLKFEMDDNIYQQNLKYQPPITLTSRVFRHESLPIFYDRCDFYIISHGLSRGPFHLSPCPRTQRLIESTAIHNFARIKSLQLDFSNLQVRLRLNLSDKNNPVVRMDVWRDGYQPYRQDEATQARRQHMLSALRKLTMEIAARQGPLRLRLGDIRRVGEMLRSIMDAKTIE